MIGGGRGALTLVELTGVVTTASACELSFNMLFLVERANTLHRKHPEIPSIRDNKMVE